MIYTVTLNPSIDYFVDVDEFTLGGVNRAQNNHKVPGGKGINVSRMLKQLGTKSTALGFVGGFTGRYIEDFLAKEEISTDFIEVLGDSRINVKLKDQTAETEINGVGPIATSEDLQNLFNKVRMLAEGDYLVLAGSVPSSQSSNLYKQLTEEAQKKGAHVIVDTSGEPLKQVIDAKPFMIKPNHHELSELFGHVVETVEDIVPLGKKLVTQGVEHVIVSMAEKGALLISKNRTLHATVPKGQLINSIGAGDSVVAGYLNATVKGYSLEDSFRFGVASGSATAFSKGFAQKEYVDKLNHQVQLKSI